MSAEPKNILFVEDDEAFAEALRSMVGEAVRLEVLGTLAAALERATPPDVAFVDLGLPDGDGVDLIRAYAERWPDLPTVVLTVHGGDRRILSAFRAGARGYLLKDDAATHLLSAAEEAMAGGAPMSPEVARRILALVAALPEPPPVEPRAPTLTDRELDVVRAMAEGCTYVQAAAALGISVNTLRTHVRNVYEKLCVGTRTEAVMAALQLGLLSR